MKNKLWVYLLAFLIPVILVYGATFTPQGTADFRSRYGLQNTTEIHSVGNLTGDNISLKGSINAIGNVTADYFIGNGSQLTDVAGASDTNETTRVRNLINSDCNSGDFMDGVQDNGTTSCSTPGASAQKTTNSTSAQYLYNNSNTITFNDTQLNLTLTDRILSTNNTASPYLHNDSFKITFNDTQLNLTIADIDSNVTTACSGATALLGNGSCLSTSVFVAIIGDVMSGDLLTTGWFTGLFNWTINLGDSHLFLFNGTTLSFNQTRNNNTILALGLSTNSTSSPYLYNDSKTITFNDTQMNNTVVNIDGDTMTGPLNTTSLRVTSEVAVETNLSVGALFTANQNISTDRGIVAGNITLIKTNGDFIRLNGTGIDLGNQKNGTITSNTTCLILQGPTATIAIC